MYNYQDNKGKNKLIKTIKKGGTKKELAQMV